MREFIPLSVPNLKGNEKKYVNEVIDSEWVSTAGSFVNRFEREIAKYLNVGDAVACQSGTAGLHLALKSLGITYEHEAIVPALTFIAAVNPVRYCGAEPIFIDCDDSLCIDPDKLLEFIEENTDFNGHTLVNRHSGKIIKTIIAVHVFGNMCDMVKLLAIARKYKLSIIEDATEALGTMYSEGPFSGRYAGTLGDIGVYSFNGNKIITTGGGGMVISKDKLLLNKVRYLSTQAKDDEIGFVHNEIGFNYRMTNLQAAVGVAQLEQLNEFIKIKKRNYDIYKEFFRDFSEVSLLGFRGDINPNYWFYSLVLNPNCKTDKGAMISLLFENRIQVRPVWGLIHEQKPYLSNISFQIERAKDYWIKTINIPCSSNLKHEEVLYVCETIKRFI